MNPYDRTTQRQQWNAWSSGFAAGQAAAKLPSPMEVGRRIVAARRDAEMTQRQLAKAIGISPSTMCLWEGGVARPNSSRILDIARVLGVDPAVFNEGVEQ